MPNGKQIQLSPFKILASKRKAAKDIAEKEAKEKKSEGFLGGLVSLLSPIAGVASKGILAALNIGTGGILGPLLAGVGTSALKGVGSSLLRALGFGGDPSKIKTTSKYGYGKKYAETISEGLEQSISERKPFVPENILADVIGSYASALTPQIGLKEGKLGFEKPELPFKDIKAGKFIEKLGGDDYWEQINSLIDPDFLESQPSMGYSYQQGGKVPTISEYFGIQGKTLGGNNKQSLAQMLGRK